MSKIAVPEASNSRDIRLFFVNSRSVKGVRGGKKISCRPFRKREKKHFKKYISRGLNFAVGPILVYFAWI